MTKLPFKSELPWKYDQSIGDEQFYDWEEFEIIFDAKDKSMCLSVDGGVGFAVIKKKAFNPDKYILNYLIKLYRAAKKESIALDNRIANLYRTGLDD